MRGSVVKMKSGSATSPAIRGDRPAPFPIVGIGASAGGLEAFSELLRQLPLQTGMAFVLVQHLDPKHSSELREILARTTKIPVSEVTDGTVVRPDHIYVIPAQYSDGHQGRSSTAVSAGAHSWTALTD
jgi:two-component system CheB/CheR fusion protein